MAYSHIQWAIARTFRNQIGVWLSIVGFLTGSGAIAAERVILSYRVFEANLSVSELTDLAETGTVSPGLRAHLRLANRDPEEIRETLNQEATVNPQFLDRALNSSPGEVALDRLGEAIHTPSRRANRQALRAALVMSAQDDGQVSLIEVIQNYPTEEVHVDGDRLVAAYNQIQNLQNSQEQIQNQIENLLDRINLF